MSNRGNFVWYELLTTDVAGAQSFYKSVVGWGTEAFAEAPIPYTMWTAGGKPMGGVYELPAEARQMGAPTHWEAYVTVEDVDAAVKQVPGLGGRVYKQPFDIPTVARAAIVADPGGAVIALFKPFPTNHESPTKQGEEQHIGWNELVTDDPEKTWTFYQKLFGWEKTEAMDMGPMGVYQLFGKDGKSFGGYMKRPPQIPVSAWTYYIRVANLTTAVEHVKAGGGKIVNGPMPVPGDDFIVNGIDPQGGFFALVSHKQ